MKKYIVVMQDGVTPDQEKDFREKLINNLINGDSKIAVVSNSLIKDVYEIEI